MPRFASFVSVAVLLTLLLAACGSSNSSSSNTAGQSSAATKQSKGLAFADCIRSHGVPNFPDPTSGGGVRIQQSDRSGSGASLKVNGVPVDGPAFQAAQKVCSKYLPAPRPISAQQLANLRAGALRMAQCMRTHGVPNFPDPSVQAGPNGGIGIRIGAAGGGGPDPSSPAFQAAQKTCGPLIQKAGGP